MGKNSAISWTHHTFNPWWGCVKVSPGCKSCYAERDSKRYGFTIWGADSPRRFFGDGHWDEPIKWNIDAARAGQRQRVFCASMADVFEYRLGLDLWRKRLWALIGITPWLDWLLLTKRPENVPDMVPVGWLNNDAPRNVWFGVSAEDQAWLMKRREAAQSIKARLRPAVLFLSAEPLLGEIELSGRGDYTQANDFYDWVIIGGESGANARRMDRAWAARLIEQCAALGIPRLFKQTGTKLAREMGLQSLNGSDPEEWPQAWRVQEFPVATGVV